MANRPSVPKFGNWDSNNVGYTVYFEKVRKNKGATAPPLHRPFNPSDPEEGVPRMVAGSSRPGTSSTGHRTHQHGRDGSGSSSGSGGRSSDREQSKFTPPAKYHYRQKKDHRHHSPSGHHHERLPSGGHGGGHHHHHHHQQSHKVTPRARSASPQTCRPGRRGPPSPVPKFGVWNEQTASATQQGFTVQFDNLKRHRDKARRGAPGGRRSPSPEVDAAALGRSARPTPLVARMFGCFTPTTRE